MLSSKDLRPEELQRNIRYYQDYAWRMAEPLVRAEYAFFKGWLLYHDGRVEPIYLDAYHQLKRQIDDSLKAKRIELGLEEK